MLNHVLGSFAEFILKRSEGSGEVMVCLRRMVIATDAPLSSRQLKRIAKRAAFGLSRTGATASHGSGDFVIAFSTANWISSKPKPTTIRQIIYEPHLSLFFQAAIEATEEAIINSLFKAETMAGRNGNVRHAIPFAVAAMAGLQCRFVAVFGNNEGEKIGVANKFKGLGDLYMNFASVEAGDRKIAVAHYPELAIALAKGEGFDVVVYGHTHEIDIHKEGETLVVNPGECGGWLTGKCTIATIDLDTLEAEIHEL